jgi:hypothetical protein
METANDMLLTLMAENGITFVSSSFSNFTCNILVRLKNKKGGMPPYFLAGISVFLLRFQWIWLITTLDMFVEQNAVTPR